ncbi:Cytochrome P450 1A2 like protein [Argiope bruennichi]|uniref:Cytochrome P450 1A2 like protein n=1 Tax=Argiope bruennichi TaxID=94029 RepID=A0A8T0FSK2_ARGBR|nr:Cytochrome P450 1A2 like protein [Argiope bruennichi]
MHVWLLSNKKNKKYPPGPPGFPIVGYLPYLTKEPYKKLTELSKIYGPVYSVRFGSTNIIVITDFELMKEAFWKDEFMGRPPTLPVELSKETIAPLLLKGNKRHEPLGFNNVRDVIDGFLLEMQKRKNGPKSTFQKEILVDLSRFLFGAGSETVRVTLDWMLFTCVARPEIQEKIHAEIDEVIGRERFPTWEDHLNMPFTEAALTEVMRWKSIVPINVPHYTLEDTELNGYFIPKHTHVFSILWAVNFNEKLWGKDVQEYKPERFLSEDGKKVVKPEYTITFSVGKRACPGKILAEIETFLYLVAILQKFELSAPPGQTISLEGKLGTSLRPPKQFVFD